MARVDLTPKQLASQVFGVTAASADITFVAGDIATGNQVDCTGKELLLVKNTSGGAAGTVTIHGKADQYGRTADITTYSVANGVTSVFGPFPTDPFRQVTPVAGKMNIDVSAVTMLLAVLRLP
jgi:hypothetical protein